MCIICLLSVVSTHAHELLCLFPWSSDEDMQSLASLMSMKQADIGNLDDFEEENEEDEENRVNQEEKAAKITGEDKREALYFISLAGDGCVVLFSVIPFPCVGKSVLK